VSAPAVRRCWNWAAAAGATRSARGSRSSRHAVDLSPESIAKARTRVPQAEFHCQDLRAPFPVDAAGVVVASLSLHYFPWPETEALVGRIRSVLSPAGVLLCRLNSTNDHHFGASGHPPIDENFYLVDGEPKRFFDRAAADRLFSSDGGCSAPRSGPSTAMSDRNRLGKWFWRRFPRTSSCRRVHVLDRGLTHRRLVFGRRALEEGVAGVVHGHRHLGLISSLVA